ncbi:MAG TPA: SRPBCC domain-containing protein [Candidatus Aquilonibacter sp.]|nr:SRPBCC domain-containing protein [Candidatus Aquilonibacter sp.]
MTTMTDTTIEKEITIDAPVERVFAALTDPAQLAQWWDNDAHKVQSFEADVRVGGAWHMISSVPEDHRVHGVYRVIEPPTALEFTWIHNRFGEPKETVVRFDLTERSGKTHLRLTHSGFPNQEMYEDHNEGWTIVLGWLDRYVQAESA